MQAEVRRTAVRTSRHMSRAALMIGTALGGLVAVGSAVLPERALAANECGSISSGTPDTVACFGNTSYPSGISYTDGSANDLTVLVFGQTGIIPPVAVNSSGNGLTVSDTAGHSIYVHSYAGTSISASGAYGMNISTTGGAGDVTVVNNSTITNATNIGLAANTFGNGTGNVTVTNYGSITTASGALDAIQARSTGTGAGDVTVVNFGALSGAHYGVFAGSNGGTVVVTNLGAISASSTTGASAFGIAIGGATSYSAGEAVITSLSSVSATSATGKAYGIDASATGVVVITSTADVTATGTTGSIGISGTGGDTVVIVSTAGISSSGTGISAIGTGAGSGLVDVVNVSSIDAHGANGIYASTSQSGGIDVVSDGSISGNSTNGVFVKNTAASGDTTVTVSGSIGSSATHNSGYGVYARGSGNGTVSVNGNASIYGTLEGIKAKTTGSGDVSIDFSGDVTGTNHNAIMGISYGSGSVLVVSRGTTHALSGGVVAINDASGATGTVTAKNYGTALGGFGGVYALNAGNGATVAANYGYANGTVAGVEARGDGSGTVFAYNTGMVHMTGGVGLVGISTATGTGAVTVTNTGTIDPGTVGTQGIILNAASSATLTVNNFGGYSYGTADGLEALNHGTGLTVLNNSGFAKGGTYAIEAQGYGGGNVTVNNSGTAYGGAASIYSNTAGTTTINNNGGAIFADSGLAIWIKGGAPTINNHGAVFGEVNLSGNATINNFSFWDAYGTSTIAAGTNVINNQGTFYTGTSSPATVSILGLTTFNNTGLVDMRNGHAGDQLWLGTGGVATWNGLAGSTLGVDADLAPTLVTDQLVIGAATGSTVVLLHDTAPGSPSAINFTGSRVVWPLSGTGTFSMATYHKGFVDYVLTQRSLSWYLVGLPSANAFEMLKLPSMGQDFWRKTGDVWSAREQEIRDSGRQPGWEMWAEAFGGAQNDTRPSQQFTVSGLSFSPNLGTNEDYRGFQMGGDQMTASHWLWGFTGGYMDQNGRFRALQPLTGTGGAVVHDDIDLTGWNVGVYGGGNWGGFFLNGLVKGDWFSADVNMLSAGSRRDVDGNSWGAKGELGFRFGGSGFYMEPLADIDWVSTHISNATMSGATFSFSDSSSSKGEIGARVGGTWGSIAPYVGAYWVDQWSGNNKMTMLTGAGCPSCMSIQDSAPGSYGKADFGFTILNWNGLQGFLKGEALFGNHTEGYAGRLGVRWHW